VVLIRVYNGNIIQLISLLLQLQAITTVDIRMLIVPTELGTYEAVLSHPGYLTFRSDPSTHIRTTVLQVPHRIYKEYGNFLSTLCTDEYVDTSLRKGIAMADIRRHCDVNSPLHYLLVDIAIERLKHTCPNCFLVTTNADNSYSPLFFSKVMEKTASSDVIMSNMITKGTPLAVAPQRGKLDLGSYAVRIHFIQKYNLNFLGSLNDRASARDYHDADGYFIEKLLKKGARIAVLSEYLFFHN
jgi:hypothetical protein